MNQRGPILASVRTSLCATVRWLDRAAVLALIAMMLLTTCDVVLRKAVNRPIMGVTELVEFALGIAIFFAVPGVFARGANIAVDMIDQWLPEWSASLQRLAAALSLLTLCLLVWHMWQPMIDVIAFKDVSADLQIPKVWFMVPAWAGIAISAVIAALVLVSGELGDEPSQ
jgi:TRAP-type transport system small permease protein